MSHFLHPRMTPKRLAYLEAVEKHGIYEPRHAMAANNCLRLGWVESMLRLPDGREAPLEEKGADISLVGVEFIGQRLTIEGREALRRARSPHAP